MVSNELLSGANRLSGSEVPFLTDMDQGAMEKMAVSMEQPAYRGRQLFEWVHGRLESDPARMTNLPREFLSRLQKRHKVARAELITELTSADHSTRKRLLKLPDGQRLETVLMEAPSSSREEDRYTVCVSSQVGCALGCAFCVTGQMGFGRHLSPGEIVEQVYHFERMLRESNGETKPGYRHITNVVYMGMGEPMANYKAVIASIRLLTSPQGMGMGARRITVSTSGVVPGIQKLTDEGLELGLAISLHAPTNDLRDRLMPVNRKYPISELMKAVKGYVGKTGRRVSFEYAMMLEVNDSVAQAWQLAHLLEGQLCHVNLIPLNQSLDPALKPSTPERIAGFRRTLEEAHIPCTVRQTRGQDILAACGQLRYTEEAKAARRNR